jgi:hypothetical protein
MSSELRNLKVELVSLVDKGANKKTIIWKSEKGESALNEIRRFTFAKTDEVKKKVYGIVYSPDQVDAHGDFMTAAEIEKAQELFMKSLTTSNKTDVQHDNKPLGDVFMCETWIVKSGDPLFPEEVGAWAYAVKVNNEEVWNKVVSGELTGFSMYGTAERIEEADTEKNLVKKFLTAFTKFFENNMDNKSATEPVNEIQIIKDFNSLAGTQEIQDYVWTLSDSIRQALNDATVTDKKAQILTNIDQFKSKIDTITIAKQIIKEVTDEKTGEIKVSKAGKVLSEANLKKIQAAIDNMNAVLAAAETAKSKNQNKDTEMTPEEIKKQVDDAVTAAVDKITKEKDEVIKGLNDKITELEKKSPGSQQEIEKEEPKSKAEVKKNLNCGFLLGGQ